MIRIAAKLDTWLSKQIAETSNGGNCFELEAYFRARDKADQLVSIRTSTMRFHAQMRMWLLQQDARVSAYGVALTKLDDLMYKSSTAPSVRQGLGKLSR